MQTSKIAVSSLTSALMVRGIKAAANRVVSLHDSLKATGKEMGKALIALQNQFTTKIKKGGTYFSQFLKENGIARSTAFYAMNAARGKSRKQPKPVSDVVRYIRAIGLGEELKAEEVNSAKVLTRLTQIWQRLCPEQGPLVTLTDGAKSKGERKDWRAFGPSEAEVEKLSLGDKVLLRMPVGMTGPVGEVIAEQVKNGHVAQA